MLCSRHEYIQNTIHQKDPRECAMSVTAALCLKRVHIYIGAEARDISGDASPHQQRNITVCSQLHEVHRALLAQVPKLPPAAADVLCDALEHVQVREHPFRSFFRGERGGERPYMCSSCLPFMKARWQCIPR